MKEKTVVITGASAGIGAALAREFSRRGARVALLARRLDRLQTLAAELGDGAREPRALAVRCDVTQDEDVRRAMDEVRARFGRIDVVVANAGFSVSGRADRLTLADYRRQFDTNIYGALSTALHAIPDLKKSEGSLVLVGSVIGYVSLPELSAYAMSKFAVRAFSDALWHELRSSRVAVTLVSPGFIQSELRKVDNQGMHRDESEDQVPSWLVMPAEKAARQVVRAVRSRRREIILTGHGKVILFLAQYFPWLARWILRFAA